MFPATSILPVACERLTQRIARYSERRMPAPKWREEHWPRQLLKPTTGWHWQQRSVARPNKIWPLQKSLSTSLPCFSAGARSLPWISPAHSCKRLGGAMSWSVRAQMKKSLPALCAYSSVMILRGLSVPQISPWLRRSNQSFSRSKSTTFLVGPSLRSLMRNSALPKRKFVSHERNDCRSSLILFSAGSIRIHSGQYGSKHIRACRRRSACQYRYLIGE